MTMDYDANVNGTYTSTNGVQGSYTVDQPATAAFRF